MKNVLILHCWGGSPDKNWYPYLSKELEKREYLVKVPQLKDPDNPTLQDWTNSCDPERNIKEGDIVVGHSLGAVFALRLAEKSKVKIGHLVLVSGWDFWDLTPEFITFFNPLMDHKAIVKNCKKITVIHSSNDPFVTIFQAGEMAKRLGADFVRIENGGHLQDSDGFKEFPKLLDVICLGS